MDQSANENILIFKNKIALSKSYVGRFCKIRPNGLNCKDVNNEHVNRAGSAVHELVKKKEKKREKKKRNRMKCNSKVSCQAVALSYIHIDTNIELDYIMIFL